MRRSDSFSGPSGSVKPPEREQSSGMMRPAGFGDDDRYIQEQHREHKPSAAAALSSAWNSMARNVFKVGEHGEQQHATGAPSPSPAVTPAVPASRGAPPLAPHGAAVRRGSHSALPTAAAAAAEANAAPAFSMAAFTSAPTAAPGPPASQQLSVGRNNGDSVGRMGSSLRPGGRAVSDAPPPGGGFSLAAFTQGKDPHAAAAAAGDVHPEEVRSAPTGAAAAAGPSPAKGPGAMGAGWTSFTSAIAKVGKGLMD